DSPKPIFRQVSQLPVLPNSSESVTFIAHLVHPYPIQEVTNFYKRENQSSYQELKMYDDGLHNDFLAGDNVFGGEIPPQPDGSIVEFYLQALDHMQVSSRFPDTPLTDVAIYVVDDNQYRSELPIYRII